MDIYQLEEEFLEERKKGMDISEIRRMLKNRGLSDEQISVVVRSIDSKTMAEQDASIWKSSKQAVFTIGVVLFFGGLLVTLASRLGWIDLGNRYIILYGPMIIGLGMMSVKATKKQGDSRYFKRMDRK